MIGSGESIHRQLEILEILQQYLFQILDRGIALKGRGSASSRIFRPIESDPRPPYHQQVELVAKIFLQFIELLQAIILGSVVNIPHRGKYTPGLAVQQ